MNHTEQTYMLPAQTRPMTTECEVIYSIEKNILIPIIYKNGSCSLQNWVDQNNTSFTWTKWENVYALVDTYSPTIITILRDPIERLISAIDMLVYQYKYRGLRLTFENFRNLEFSNDTHLIPQSCFVPLSNHNRYTEYQVNWADDLSAYKQGWIDILQLYGISDRLDSNNKFFQMTASSNVMEDIATYILEPTLAVHWNNRKADKEWNTVAPTVLPDEYIEYAKTVYQSDYNLINTVKFENA